MIADTGRQPHGRVVPPGCGVGVAARASCRTSDGGAERPTADVDLRENDGVAGGRAAHSHVVERAD